MSDSRAILKLYNCPLKRACQLSSSADCPFSHGRREPLPDALCVPYLLNECRGTIHPYGELPCCTGGLHPELKLLAQPKEFKQRLKILLLSRTIADSLKIETQKELQVNPIGRCSCPTTGPKKAPLYAILSCGHNTCGHCYQKHRDSFKRNCVFRSCSKPVKSYYFWPSIPLTEEERSYISMIDRQNKVTLDDYDIPNFAAW